LPAISFYILIFDERLSDRISKSQNFQIFFDFEWASFHTISNVIKYDKLFFENIGNILKAVTKEVEMKTRILALVLLSMLGCKKDDDKKSSSGGGGFDAPAVEPPVTLATPLALQGNLTLDLAPDVALTVKEIFTKSYGRQSGGTAIGLIKSYLLDLDFRVEEVGGRIAADNKCLANSAAAHTVNLGFTGGSLDVNLQCHDNFSQGEGGLAFGRSGNDFSMWLYLTSLPGQGSQSVPSGAYVANINSDTSIVDLMAISKVSDASTLKYSVYRVKADPNNKSYELSLASEDPMMQNLGCGLRLISNGTLIKATAKTLFTVGASCSQATTTELCLNASDYTTASDCSALSYTLPAIDPSAIAGTITAATISHTSSGKTVATYGQ